MLVMMAAVFAGCMTEPKAVSSDKAPLKVAVYADLGPGGIGAAEWYRIVNDSPDMELK